MEILNISHLKSKTTSFEVRLTKRELRIFNSGKYAFKLVPKENALFIDAGQTDSEKLMEVILTYFGLDIETLKHKSRHRSLVEVRMFISYYFRNYTRFSLVEIGRLFNRDHATVIHMMKRWTSEIAYDDVKEKKEEIDKMLIRNKLI